jgi:hypothetical protein
VRVEVFDPDRRTGGDGRTLLTGQVARAFGPNFEWQVNWVYTEYQHSRTHTLNELVSQWTVRM